MRLHPSARVACVILALALLASLPGRAQSAVIRFPADKTAGVNPDTHLVLTFPSAPALGKSGQIRIYDAADHRLVDTLDLSIPAGPAPGGPRAPSQTHSPNEVPGPRASIFAPGHPTNATARGRHGPRPRGDAPSKEYQLTIIGGVIQGFHFYPVIIHGNVATIYPHNNLLTYGRSYLVQVDPGVLTVADGSFGGITGDQGWTFSTKASAPAADSARVVVADDGTGDFNTVQGALDFVPDNPPQRVTIFIKDGNYEEIVFFHDKANLTLQGEDREKVQVGYGNNSVFNGPPADPKAPRGPVGPSRRGAFTVYDCTGIELSHFSVSNTIPGQAEGLTVSGLRNIVNKLNIKGSGDALNLRGPVYLTDSTIVGDGDTILGVGPAFFNHCVLRSHGAYMWIRNPAANHGNVFVDCTFETPTTALARRLPASSARPATRSLPGRPTTMASTIPMPRRS